MSTPELLIRDYVDHLPDSTHALAREVVHNATPAFRNQQRIIQNLTPATEGEEVVPLLEQFQLLQKKSNRFGIIISCNEPDTSDGRELDKVEGDVVAFQRQNPNLPLSYFRTAYPEGVPIGTIRLGLGNVAIVAETLLSPTFTDTILANCDADTHTLSSNSMLGMEKLFAAHPNEHIAASPKVLHARSGGKLPNMDRVTGWKDVQSYYDSPSLESHGAMRTSTYIVAGGHNPAVTFGETGDIVNRLQERGLQIPVLDIPAVARVSPRKMFKFLEEGLAPSHTPVRSRREAYRGSLPDTDLTSKQADEHLNGDRKLISYAAQELYNQITNNFDPGEPIPAAAIDGLKRRLSLLQKTYGGSKWQVRKLGRRYTRAARQRA